MKNQILALAAILAVMGSCANAALIEVVMAGSTDNAEGSIDYAPGGTFTASFIFDTDVAFPDSVSDGVGNFREVGVPLRGRSGLMDATITTPLGTVTFDRGLFSTGDRFEIAAVQIEQFGEGINGQSFDASVRDVTFGDNSPALFSDIAGFEPVSFSLSAISQGGGDTFFDDPWSLLSNAESLDLSDFFGALIIVSFLNGEDTELPIGQLDFFDIRLLGDTDPSEVPIPGAFVLMLAGLAGLKFAARRKKMLKLQSGLSTYLCIRIKKLQILPQK